MQVTIHFIKNKIFELSTILCFVLPPAGIFFMLVLSLAALYSHIKNKRLFPFSFISLFFLCLLVSTVGAALQMAKPFLFIESLRVLFYWGIYLKVMDTGTSDKFRFFRWIVIGCGIYDILIGWVPKLLSGEPVLAFLTGTELLGYKNYNRLIGSTYNPNFTMFLLLLGIAFLFAEMLENAGKKRWKSFIWKVLPLFILSKGVFDTGSRAGVVAMICIYLIFFFRLNRGVFIAGLIFITAGARKLTTFIPRNQSIAGSFWDREKIWLHSFELWENHFLFGTTPIGFEQAYASLFHKDIFHAHDIFIGLFVEYGVIGGIAFLAVFLMAACKLSMLFFVKKNYRYLNIFLLSLPIIVLTGFLDEPVFSPQIGLLAVVLLSYWEWYTKSMHVPLNINLIKKITVQSKN